ncbi:MAG: SAM-dependent methyltransferase [Stackebrandtia sp.]
MIDSGSDPALAAEAIVHPQFPRASRYDPRWQADNAMGPNPMWLAESLGELMDLRPGMRVLDLGCGRAITSIFLAKEFDVRVVAADLWIQPGENWRRIEDAGVADRVTPLHAEAHDLKFAEDYFDAIVSLDAYHYFGTAELYLSYILKFLRPGGQLGIVAPGVVEDVGEQVPWSLSRIWEPDLHVFHSPQWWRRHWGKTGLVEAIHADLLPDGWKHWLRWEKFGAVVASEEWREHCRDWAQALEADAGETLGFVRLTARKPVASG